MVNSVGKFGRRNCEVGKVVKVGYRQRRLGEFSSREGMSRLVIGKGGKVGKVGYIA